jgi:hypothetical protein
MATIAIDDAIETLGLIAARCDIMALDSTLTTREAEELEARAEHYRALQMNALDLLQQPLYKTAAAFLRGFDEKGKWHD